MSLVLPEFTPLFLAAIAVTFAAGVLRGFAGFGSAMVVMPLFAWMYGPGPAIAIVTVMEMTATLHMMRAALRSTDWPTITPMIAGAVIGTPCGIVLLQLSDPELVRRGIGLIVLSFVALSAIGWRWRGRRTPWHAGTAGWLSGTMGALSGIGGPPVILYFLSDTKQDAASTRGSMIIYFQFVGVVLLASLIYAGLLTMATATISVLLLVPFVTGTLIGQRLFRGASEKLFRNAALALLAVIGVAALFG